MVEEIIKLHKVWKTYGKGAARIDALKDANITIRKGEFVAIWGPSGAGKSTMMNLVGSLDVPSQGIIYLDGRNIQDFSESDLAVLRGRKIGFIFQQFNLIPTLSAMENVILAMTFQGKDRDFREKRAKELLEFVGLGHRLNNRPNQLSGGEQQRVAIARALVNNPSIILADEPTGNLDSKTSDEIMYLFDEIHKQGNTIILVTHEEDIARHAHRIVRLKDGLVESDMKNDSIRQVVSSTL